MGNKNKTSGKDKGKLLKIKSESIVAFLAAQLLYPPDPREAREYGGMSLMNHLQKPELHIKNNVGIKPGDRVQLSLKESSNITSTPIVTMHYYTCEGYDDISYKLVKKDLVAAEQQPGD